VARIVLGAYMVRYPLGGVLSSSLQWLVALHRLGHDTYMVEKARWPGACFDPVGRQMTDDCSYGTAAVHALLSRFGLGEKWCFVDVHGRYHGLSRERVEDVLGSADVFFDRGTHGAWLDEAAHARVRVLHDGEPGFNQIKMEKALAAGRPLPEYDYYYTVGRNVGTPRSTAPTGGKTWRYVDHPVVVDLFPPAPRRKGAAFTTVMNWQSHEAIEFNGVVYGQKDAEFERFMTLPRLVPVPLEVSVSGKTVPSSALVEHGWRMGDAHTVTRSFDSYVEYIRDSQGEFSVAKNVFVATNSGWFGDRSAAYLASGRPVVMQETGFSAHLPCGRGLFAVRTADEAAAAIEEIAGDYERHSAAATDIAREYLDGQKVVGQFLAELGV
jgi:hypothetical protein